GRPCAKARPKKTGRKPGAHFAEPRRHCYFWRPGGCVGIARSAGQARRLGPAEESVGGVAVLWRAKRRGNRRGTGRLGHHRQARVAKGESLALQGASSLKGGKWSPSDGRKLTSCCRRRSSATPGRESLSWRRRARETRSCKKK